MARGALNGTHTGNSGLVWVSPGCCATTRALPKEQRETLDIINRSGEHLRGLINGVLDMAKIEEGRTAVERSAFDLPGLMEGVVSLMRQRAAAKGLELALDQAPGVPCFIQSDELKLRQAVLNLVENAVQFTSQGSVTLRLRSSPGAQFDLLFNETSG